MGLEPTRSCDHRHLKPARLPIPPLLHLERALYFASARYILYDLSLIVNRKIKKIQKILNACRFALIQGTVVW